MKYILAMPTLGHQMTIPIAMFTRSLESLSSGERHFTTVMINGYEHIPYARNRLVSIFLNDPDATHLWFIDSDVLPNEKCLSMLDVDADIVCGVYPIYREGSETQEPGVVPSVYEYSQPFAMWRHIQTFDLNDGAIIAGAGTGMMIIKRRVLEDESLWLTRKWIDTDGSEHEIDVKDAVPVFREIIRADGRRYRTDDLDFCYRAAKAGYSIKAVPSALCGHIKKIDILGVVNLVTNAFEAGRVAGQKGDIEAKAEGMELVN